MSQRLFLFLTTLVAPIVLIALIPLGACGRVAPTSSTPDGWYDDLELARAEAARTGRPILAVFR